jgi:hypothetical protein
MKLNENARNETHTSSNRVSYNIQKKSNDENKPEDLKLQLRKGKS